MRGGGLTAAALLACGAAQAAPHPAKTQVEVVLDNQTSHRIETVMLAADGRAPGGRRVLHAYEFTYRVAGEIRHSAFLPPGTRGAAVLPVPSLRPQCVFDVTLSLDRGTVYRMGHDLCRDPRIAVSDVEARLPAAAPQAAPAPPRPRPAGGITPPDSRRWQYLGRSVEHTPLYLDLDSSVGDTQTRFFNWKYEWEGKTRVARERLRCDVWRHTVLGENVYAADGTLESSVDYSDNATQNERPVKDGSLMDVLGKKVCQR